VAFYSHVESTCMTAYTLFFNIKYHPSLTILFQLCIRYFSVVIVMFDVNAMSVVIFSQVFLFSSLINLIDTNLIDKLVDYFLTFSEQYFSYTHEDENKFNKYYVEMRKR
jgi:hypothetical protein